MKSDIAKTMSFAGVALATLAVALFLSQPAIEAVVEQNVNKPLFEDFTDPTAAASLSIVKVDESRGQLQKFQVDRSPQGRWVIPSHGGYPADATDQMRDAATSLINLNVIAIASQAAGDQELYGVVEPSEEKLEGGLKGFGIAVDFKDKAGKDLARAIIGKQVSGAPTQRFIRKAGQDPIYVVDLNVDKLSTKFEDWIEKDLLKVSPWDIDRVAIKDYQFLPKPEADGRMSLEYDPRLDIVVGWDADANSWVVDRLTKYQKAKPVASELQPDEELNKEKLDELKSTLDNLQIVDVRPKPKGLGEDLSVDDAAFKNQELRDSLQGLGFLPAQLGRKREFLGTNGEVNVGMKDGVEYVLRFGNSAGAETDSSKLKRYLFVLARLDESRLKPPTLEPLPDAPVDVPASPTEKPSSTPPEDQNAGQDEKNPENPPATEAKPADEPKESEFDLKRKRIEKENQRKVDDYTDRRKKAVAKVKELNARFAPWYYVISDDEFKKIHLTWNEVVKERSGPGQEGFGPDAFRDLERGGIKPPPAPQAPMGGPGGLPPGLRLPGM